MASETGFDCPKRMSFGPCGGVRSDGRCEVDEHRCTFLELPTVAWHADADAGAAARAPRTEAARRMLDRLDAGPVVVADFPARALDAESTAACARVLRGVDAVLAGDAPDARVQFPPAYRSALIQAEGARVWCGFNDRDRNRVALEGELAALAHLGVAGVHCVTGDHTLSGTRPDALPVFDLDSTRTAALARAAGHLVSVAESPAAPPQERRAARLVEKLRAGADVCFIDHCSGLEPAAAFVRQLRGLGGTARMIVCVPVVVDLASAELLASFAGAVMPPGFLEGILAARDVRAAGIAAAVELSLRLLDTGLVDGVDLSGGPGGGDALAYAEALAESAQRLGL